ALSTDVCTSDVEHVEVSDGMEREESPTRCAIEDEPRQARGVARQVDRFEVALAGSNLRAFLEGFDRRRPREFGVTVEKREEFLAGVRRDPPLAEEFALAVVHRVPRVLGAGNERC